MMPRLCKLILLCLLLPAQFTGCTKEEYLPWLTGSIVGYLYTFDEYGSLLDDHSQVKVTAIGKGMSFTGKSDSRGRFELKEVPTGTYELHLEKDGFGTMKQFGVQHLGGEPTILPIVDSYEYAYFLYKMPTTLISNLSIINDSIALECSTPIAEMPDRISIQIYFSTRDNFSLTDAEYHKIIYPWKADGFYTTKLSFHDAPFEAGETVYFKACYYNAVGSFYPDMDTWRTIHGVDTYFDYERNATIYPNLGEESATYSFIFPE